VSDLASVMTPPLFDFARSDSAVIRNMRWRASAKRIATNLNFTSDEAERGTIKENYMKEILSPYATFAIMGE
jgi:hypothetical protein